MGCRAVHNWRMDLAWVFESKHYDTPKWNGVLDFGLLSGKDMKDFSLFNMFSFVFLTMYRCCNPVLRPIV